VYQPAVSLVFDNGLLKKAPGHSLPRDGLPNPKSAGFGG
jgi:hypothetical protein